MVPGSPSSVEICRGGFGVPYMELNAAVDPAQLARTFNSLPISQGSDVCEGNAVARQDAAAYVFKFSYSEGPPVVVQATNRCTPAISNGSLASDSWPAVAALLKDLGIS